MKKRNLFTKIIGLTALLLLGSMLFSCANGINGETGLEVENALFSSPMITSQTGLRAEVEGDYEVNYIISNQWNSGFTASIDIVNQTGKDINGWEVKWIFPDKEQKLLYGWNGKFTQTDLEVIITNESYNALIPDGGKVNVGFNGTHGGNNPVPGNITLSSSSSTTDPDDYPAEILRDVADRNNLIVGAAVSPEHFSKTDYHKTLTTHFNALVAENHMKFSYLEPEENKFTFENADSIMTLAKDNKMAVRGHALFWHSNYQIPQWIKDKDFSELKAAVENHVEGVMDHFKNRIYAWDVFNEVVIDNGSGFRNRTASGGNYSVWASSPGDDSLIKAAFFKADEVRKKNGDPVKLFLCDYSIEEKGHVKADKVFEVVKGWVKEGVPIDGIAFQGHFMEKYTPNYSAIKANIDRYQALGLEVQFTELDIRIEMPITEAKLQRQASIYGELLKLSLEKGITNFIVWGVTDKYSWVPGVFSNYGGALLFDDNYKAKPAYYELVEILN